MNIERVGKEKYDALFDLQKFILNLTETSFYDGYFTVIKACTTFEDANLMLNRISDEIACAIRCQIEQNILYNFDFPEELLHDSTVAFFSCGEIPTTYHSKAVTFNFDENLEKVESVKCNNASFLNCNSTMLYWNGADFLLIRKKCEDTIVLNEQMDDFHGVPLERISRIFDGKKQFELIAQELSYLSCRNVEFCGTIDHDGG